MKPYYQEDGITIYHGDCREVMPYLEMVNCTVTSPPYGTIREYGGFEFDWREIIAQLWHREIAAQRLAQRVLEF